MDITYCGRSSYWMVDIKCKDRTKLLFDTVCTLADCGYDVFHATIDSEGGFAHQEVGPCLSAGLSVCWIWTFSCVVTCGGHLWIQPRLAALLLRVIDTHALARCHVTPWLGLDPVGHYLQFYVRPRGGVQTFDESRAARLRAMVVASVQRRHPKGLKVHVHSVDRYGCLAALTRVLKAANLSVTRAKVRLQEAVVMLPAAMQCL